MLHSAKHWLKAGNSPLSRMLYQCAWQMLHFELPQMKVLSKPLLVIHLSVTRSIQTVLRVCYWTPLFKASLDGNAKQLYLYGGLPYISGPLKIAVGQRTRISGQTTFTGRTVKMADNKQPQLTIGSNVDVGWQTTIAVGTQVSIGDNVRIAGRALLAGYPGHPVNAQDRAAGKPDLDSQIGDIILEDDVWLATGVSVMAGVRIGKGTIVAAGSVVTHDLPPGVLAGGIPAKIIKSLEESR